MGLQKDFSSRSVFGELIEVMVTVNKGNLLVNTWTPHDEKCFLSVFSIYPYARLSEVIMMQICVCFIAFIVKLSLSFLCEILKCTNYI